MGASMEAIELFTVLGQSGKGPLKGLKPKIPAPPPQPGMPSQQELLQQQQLQASKNAAARYGRAATVLSSNSGTGDQLGP